MRYTETGQLYYVVCDVASSGTLSGWRFRCDSDTHPVQHLPPRVVLPREVVHAAVQTRHPVARHVGPQLEIVSKTCKQLIIGAFQALKPGALNTRAHPIP
jgi:hypothetical protein